jgi:lauroyl/myristoyl acyltransferase
MLYALYILAIRIVRNTSRSFVNGLAKFIVSFDFIFGTTKRRTVIKNISQITGLDDRRKIKALAYSLYVNFALNIVDYFRFLDRNEEAFKKTVDFADLKERLQELASSNNGTIIITAHLGNWEVAGFLVGYLGFKPHGIGLAQKDAKVDELYKKLRTSWNVTVHPFNGGAIGVFKALKQNEIASIVSDRDINHDGSKMCFFGQCVTFPKGAATLAYRTGARSVFGYTIRENGHYKAIISPEIIIKRSVSEQDFVRMYVEKFTQLLEDAISKYPDQWFQFFDYFKEYKCY